jgi:hypothetical protein
VNDSDDSNERHAVAVMARAALAALLGFGAAACAGSAHGDDCKKPGVCFPGGPTPPGAPTPP